MKRCISFIFGLFLAACAVQSRPQGGPKDETPPVIVKRQPEVGALNYVGNSADFVFDEYIQAPKLRGNIQTSPALDGLEFEVIGKRLKLRWDEDQLIENTTYRISLGNEIGDLNENNKYNNLEVVWSTGSYIDSMQLAGEILKTGTGSFEDLTVWLLPAGTDTISLPLFTATPSKSGTFGLKYLPVDTFDVLVFEDLNFNKTWEAESESFGFAKNVASSLDSSSIQVFYSSAKFEFPLVDTSAIDSVQNYIDTTSRDNLGQVQFIYPPTKDSVVLFAVRNNDVRLDLSTGPITDTTISPSQYYAPGKYQLSGYIDINNNGLWDGPSWFEGTRGEPIISGQNFEIKANWELEQPINLPKTGTDEKDD